MAAEQLLVENERADGGDDECHHHAHDHRAQVFEMLDEGFFLIAFAAEVQGDFFAHFEDFLKDAGPHKCE
jgi:hypothetical protein